MNSFCLTCVKYVVSDNLKKQTKHCNKCDKCHLNNKNFYCDICFCCINLSNDLEIISHKKRHSLYIELNTKKLKLLSNYKVST